MRAAFAAETDRTDPVRYATASAHEQFLRAAAALPNQPPVVFNLMGPPRDDREGRKVDGGCSALLLRARSPSLRYLAGAPLERY